MKITYQSDYTAKDRKFSVGKVNMFSGYGMQMSFPRPVLTEGKLAPGEQCVIIFGISKEEYELKETDSEALAALAEKIRKNIPGDRIIMTVVVDLTGKAVNKTVKVKGGESIDNGAFIGKYRLQPGPIDALLMEARKVQVPGSAKDAPAEARSAWEQARKAVANALGTIDRIYTPDDAQFKGRFPYVREGFIELFTTLERADKAKAFTQKMNMGEDAWIYREITSEEFPSFIERCVEMGLQMIKVDPFSLDVTLLIGDISDRETPRNAVLRGNMLQEAACGVAYQKLKDRELPEPDRRRMLERVLTLQNFTRREIGNSILWSVCTAPNGIKGKLCTKDAKEKMDNAPELNVAPPMNCVLVGDKQTDAKFMPVFTSEIAAAAFSEKVNGNPRPIAMTFDDIRTFTEKLAQVKGIILDIEGIGLRVMKEQYNAILDLRDKPRQIVRIQPPKPETPAPVNTPAPAPVAQPVLRAVPAQDNSLPDPDMGGLPDPDQFDLPTGKKETTEQVSEKESETKSENEGSTEKNKEKGGFFKRLFGKGKK